MPAISMQDLENAKVDVDHIAAVATSLAPTETDRLGHVKQTLAGAVGSIATITDRGAWASGAAYLMKDLVTVAGVVYVCVLGHTAGATFSGDSAKWRVYQGLTVAEFDAFVAGLAGDAGAAAVGEAKFGTVQAALDRAVSALRGDTGKSYRVVSAILRNTGAGWFVLDDDGHNPIGVNSVTVNPDGTLHVDYDNLGQSNIVNTLLAVPDETFASMGLVLGSSVSNEFCNIDLFAPLNFRVNLDSGAITAPDYFLPEITRTLSDNGYIITHPKIAYSDNVTLQAFPVGGTATAEAQYKTSPISDTSTFLEVKTTLYTYISYTGSEFTCTLGNSGSQISAAWNGALLSVVRPDVGVDDIGSIKLTARYPYQVFFDGVSGVNADVKFATKSGVDVVTPDTSMKLTYSETFPTVKAGVAKLTSGTCQFSAPLAKINANNLVSAGGNIWLFGIMEEVS